jgi:hypothetical protein
MRTYYVFVNVEDRRLGAYVSAENIAEAFNTATARYKMRHPRLHVETIAAQEMADGTWNQHLFSLREPLTSG